MRSTNDWVMNSTAVQLADSIQRRAISPTEVLNVFLDRIARFNPAMNAIVTLDEEQARLRARQADEAIARGNLWGPLHGLPVTIKDSIKTQALRTTVGMAEFSDYIPAEDSTVVARLRRAGAIILGKSNVSENLSDWQTTNPLFGRTNNPWDPTRTPGGSSGGAATAVALGLTAFDIGSDLGGSIRVPAHYCGVCGFKPTEGRVPQTGHMPEFEILNAIGPLARSIDDLALIFEIITDSPDRNLETPPIELTKLRVAWTTTFPGIPIAHEIAQALEKFAAKLPELGVQASPCLPDTDIERQYRVRETLRDFVVKESWLKPSQRAQVKPAEYIEALTYREHFMRRWEEFFDRWDVFLCPAAMTTAFPHCAPNTSQVVNGIEVNYEKMFYFSTIFNCTGHPSVVIPLAIDSHGLPIGIQIVGPRFGDERLLAISAAISKIIPPLGMPPFLH